MPLYFIYFPFRGSGPPVLSTFYIAPTSFSPHSLYHLVLAIHHVSPHLFVQAASSLRSATLTTTFLHSHPPSSRLALAPPQSTVRSRLYRQHTLRRRCMNYCSL